MISLNRYLLHIYLVFHALVEASNAARSDIDSSLPRSLLQKYALEFCGIAFILIYFVYTIYGRRLNSRVADAWCRAFAGPHGMLAKNFHISGSADPECLNAECFWKESPSVYKFYCSGRRFCSGALITLDLKSRQDLFMQLYYLLASRPDYVQIEVFMSEAHMPPTVMAVGMPKVLSALRKEDDRKDLAYYTNSLTISKEKLPSFPVAMSAMVEHSSVFYDLFSEPRVAQVFSKSGQHSNALRYFRSLLISSEGSGPGPQTANLVLTLAMPPAAHMEQLQPLMGLAWTLVDLLGAYKVTPELRKRAQDLRAKVAQDALKQDAEQRKELIMMKKMEKMEAERARAARAGPEALAKYEEARQRAMQKKAMRQRVKVVR